MSIEQAVAAPLCTSKLAAAGARVIKVEREEGDFARAYDSVVNGESSYFVWLNHGKESLVLDLKNNGDRDFLLDIIREADVFVQNLAPGAAARLGLGSDTLAARFPRLVICNISGYGESGPYRDMKAYDLLIQCETGLTAITGSPAEPGRVGISICDIACGVSAHARILEALIDREHTGKGSCIDVSLFGSMADWMNVPYLHQVYGGQAPQRVGINHPSIAPYGAYQAGDGGTIVLGIQNDREFSRFCDIVCGRPDLAFDERFVTNSARVGNRRQLDDEIGTVFRGMTKNELTARLQEAAIAFAFLNSIEEFSKHPQLELQTIETVAGSVKLIAPAGHVASKVRSRVPRLGEHTGSIRARFAKAKNMNETAGNSSRVDIDDLRSWTRNEPIVLTDTLDLRPALGLAAMFEQAHRPELGDALPPLWHWIYFSPAPLSSDLGNDGHPARGGFIPPVPLPRRMWAASRICFHTPLHFGETVNRKSGISTVALKEGASGPLVFVNIDHEFSVDGEIRISEEQTVVYLGKRRGRKPESIDKAYCKSSDWSRCIQTDPVLLFRYSALSSNTHRIHYDREFAVHEEGYSGLVVHAPLTVTLLTGLLLECCPDLRITELSFRAVRPLVDKMPFTIHGKREDNETVALWALDGNQQLAVQATAGVVEV